MMDSGILWKPKVVVVETSPTCPRCGSTNTKFCYYNNYSLTQPRYFCKSCRRYWTKGGSLRNVPVGGGCRKSTRSSRSSSSSGGNYKHSASSSIHQDDVVLGHLNIINSSRNYFSTNTITTTAAAAATGSLAPPVTDADDNGRPNIDLALVYSNFLNPININPGPPPPPLPVPPPPPPPYRTSSVFLECVSFSDRLSLENEHVTTRDGNIDPFNYFGGGMNSFDDEKQQQQETTTVRDHLQQNNNNNNNLLLAEPNYLAGEETMVWPSSDLICPRYPVIDAVHESTMEILPRVQDSNQVDDDHEEDGSPLFPVPNYGIFSGLDNK